MLDAADELLVVTAEKVGATDATVEEQLINSIKQELMVLPSETKVYPGHGPATTVGEERRAFL